MDTDLELLEFRQIFSGFKVEAWLAILFSIFLFYWILFELVIEWLEPECEGNWLNELESCDSPNEPTEDISNPCLAFAGASRFEIMLNEN